MSEIEQAIEVVRDPAGQSATEYVYAARLLADVAEHANEVVDAALAYRRVYRFGERGATAARERLFRLLDRPVKPS